MTPEERQEHRKKSKRKLERERLEALKKVEEAVQKAEEANEKYDVVQEKLQQAGRTQSLVENDIRKGREQVAKMATQVETARKDLNDAKQEKAKVQKEKTALEERVEELVNAVGDPKEVTNMVSFDKMVFAYNPEGKCAILDNLKANGKLHITIMDVLTATFEEIDKIKARKIGFFDDPKEVRKKRDADIKSVMTDMQTILRSFASVHKDELTRRSRAIVKQEMRQNAIAKVAATTASLFFGYADAATTISQSCGGGGCNNDLPRRKDKEYDLAFARRCHQAAKVMIQGSHKRGLHL